MSLKININTKEMLKKLLAEIPPHKYEMSWDEFWQRYNQYENLGRTELLLHHVLYNYNPEWNYRV